MDDIRPSPERPVPVPAEVAPRQVDQPALPSQPITPNVGIPANPDAPVTMPVLPDAIVESPNEDNKAIATNDRAGLMESVFDSGNFADIEKVFAGDESPTEPDGS